MSRPKCLCSAVWSPSSRPLVELQLTDLGQIPDSRRTLQNSPLSFSLKVGSSTRFFPGVSWRSSLFETDVTLEAMTAWESQLAYAIPHLFFHFKTACWAQLCMPFTQLDGASIPGHDSCWDFGLWRLPTHIPHLIQASNRGDVSGGQPNVACSSHVSISHCLRNESKLEKLSGHIGGTQHCLSLIQ